MDKIEEAHWQSGVQRMDNMAKAEDMFLSPLREVWGTCNCGWSEEDHADGGIGGCRGSGCVRFDQRFSAICPEDYGNDR